MRRFTAALMLMLLVLPATGGGAASGAETRPNSGPAAVVCFGDSITHAGYPAELAKRLNVNVVNAGVPGETTAMGLRRIDRDVVRHHPRVVVILFGTNDSRLAEPGIAVPVEKYEANLKRMVEAVREAGGRAVICTIPPIDEAAYYRRHDRRKFDAAGGLEKVLLQYRAASLRVAESQKTPVVDLHEKLAKEPWRAADGVHPTADGNRIIAKLVGEAVAPLLK